VAVGACARVDEGDTGSARDPRVDACREYARVASVCAPPPAGGTSATQERSENARQAALHELGGSPEGQAVRASRCEQRTAALRADAECARSLARMTGERQ
jgi:hypothetical protein